VFNDNLVGNLVFTGKAMYLLCVLIITILFDMVQLNISHLRMKAG